MDEKILVTGGAGFIGSHIVDELIEQGNNVIVLDDLSGGFIENINTQAEFVNGSIEDTRLVQKIFRENKISHVFHLAAYAAEGLSHFIRRFNYKNNLLGSINLINESIKNKIKCFVFTSSIAVYGKNQLPMREDIVPTPEDPYGIAKLAIEQDLKCAKELFGLDYIIFRPHNVIGARQNINDKYRNVLGIFINQIKRNLPITIFGDGEQTRAFTGVKDIAPVIANSIKNQQAYNQIYNIGADKPYTVNQLTEIVKRAMNKPEHEVIYLEARKEVKDAYSDHNKAKEILGYQDTTSFEEGIKEMIEWAENASIRETEEFKNIEIRENLPKSWRSKEE
ncbi:NAD-dependent epimerase/dehydratase family protein [archaeon]|jgi:UDP-glucose 4-epimerase|nr:NAD-dependent epimerase/dehydratase family protein [archaeon]